MIESPSPAPVASPSSALEKAVAHRLSCLHGGDTVDLAAIDCRASFFEPTGFYLGEHVLDSLDVVEMIVALEVDFGISIVEAYDVTQFDSIEKLSLLLESVVGDAVRASFERTWHA